MAGYLHFVLVIDRKPDCQLHYDNNQTDPIRIPIAWRGRTIVTPTGFFLKISVDNTFMASFGALTTYIFTFQTQFISNAKCSRFTLW